MLLVSTSLQPSARHGLGCFANEKIVKGQVVWVFDDRVDTRLPVSELPHLPPATQTLFRTYGYETQHNGQSAIALCGDYARHINHSDSPNLIEGEGGVNIAARDIEPGEELTSDYYAFDAAAREKLAGTTAQTLPAMFSALVPLEVNEAAPPPTATPAEPTGHKSLWREIIETIILTVLIYLAVNFVSARFRIEGSSMEPSMHNDQYVLVDKISYMLGKPQRGDVIVFNYPQATERDFIKRVIGLPGETISVMGGVVYVNDQPLTEPYINQVTGYEGTWTLSAEQYFVMGDNRNSSSDSHIWGPLDYKYFVGRAVFVYWPPDSWGLVPHYTYTNTNTTICP